MEKVLFYLGPLPIYKFGLTMALGILAGFWVVNWEAGRKQLDQDRIFNLVMLVVIGGLIGARLFYILAYAPGYYFQHAVDMLKIYEGGLSIHGGIIGAALAGWWYARKHHLDFWLLADTLVPGTILGQAIARIGCDVFGLPMAYRWPWGVMVGGSLLHPVQIYEIVLDLILFLILWGKRSGLKYQGQLFTNYLFGYALIRFIIEFFRDNPLILGPLTPAHLTSMLFMVIAIVLHIYLTNTNRIETDSLGRGWRVSWKALTGTILLGLASSGLFYCLSSLV
ncbi:MAG: prolipoprotein diacylglyceryl transferase [Methylocystaceae bacterium]